MNELDELQKDRQRLELLVRKSAHIKQDYRDFWVETDDGHQISSEQSDWRDAIDELLAREKGDE